MSTKVQLDDLGAVKTLVEALKDFPPAEQERIIRWTREKLNLGAAPPPISGMPATSPPAPAGARVADPTPAGNKIDIKTFVERKAPPSDAQFAAVVAYYFRFEAELRKESISSADLQDACRTAGRARLKNPAQTLVNAHTQGLLDRGERGTYTINTVGENLVAMALPSDGKAAAPARRVKKAAAKAPKKAIKKRPGKK